MKKMLTIFMIVAALAVCMIPFASAETTDPALTVTSSVTEAKPGDTVVVEVAIVNNVEAGIIGASVQMSAEGLTLDKLTKVGFADATANKNTGKISFAGNEDEDGNYIPYVGDGVLFSATYTIPADAAAGDYTISATTYASGIRDDNGGTMIAGGVASSVVVHVHADADGNHMCDDANCGGALAEWHTMVNYPAVESTCSVNGNIEYNQCSVCGYAEDSTGRPLSRYGWIAGLAEHRYSSACDVTCEECGDDSRTGAAEHTYNNPCDGWCAVCYEFTNPTAAHKIVKVEAKEAVDCQTPGNIEYWTCEYGCGACWDNENGTGMPLNPMMVKTFADHSYFYKCDAHCQVCGELTNEEAAHSIKHVEAVEAKCDAPGNIEYWTCEHCNGCWDNENATGMPLNAMTVKTFAEHEYLFECDAHCKNCGELTNPEAAHSIKHVEAVAPTCDSMGNIEYWYCEYCGSCWDNEECTGAPYNQQTVKLWPTHTNVVHMDAVEPGCHYEGHIEYWLCYDCGGCWQDEDLTQVTNVNNVIIPELGGEVVHVEAKEPTCYVEGNIEHWYCEECGQVWQDEARTQLTNSKNVVLGAEHTNLVHMDAVEPGCHYEGHIEHWVCYDCEGVWQDELLRQVTNHKNVVLDKLGGEVIHVEAKDPTCTELGNIEHWYCEECNQVWQDEALTQLTNHQNVKVGELGHTLTHVEAVEATAEADGNIEYWYCEVCGKYYADAEATEEITEEETVVPFNPETGDSSMLIPAALLAMLSITGAALLVSKKNLLK